MLCSVSQTGRCLRPLSRWAAAEAWRGVAGRGGRSPFLPVAPRFASLAARLNGWSRSPLAARRNSPARDAGPAVFLARFGSGPADRRHAVIKVEDVSLSAKLVDLPCVIESLKTFDKKKFYKTADISQMLVCSADGDLPSSQEESVTSTDLSVTRNKERETEKKYIWKHGRWEVIADEETKEIESQGFIPSFPAFPATSGYKQSDTSSEHDVVQEIFSDSSSSNHDNEDENEEQEDDDDDDEEEEEEEEEDDFEEVLERELQAKIIEYGQHETKEGASSIVMEIQKHIHYKEKKLQQIQNKAQRQKNIIRKVENLILKNHLKSVLENLAVQEKQKNDQVRNIFLNQAENICYKESPISPLIPGCSLTGIV
ncbi:Transcription initiation factor TFIID subunit 7-like protein [Heterocephalus glaber]|uniref:Transcription initiation factor TFIID subunit 7-like protein n=1 Tax=Heterocephalus glaber TaxID=10181 RepID=G5C2S4_HETGA|nr:Transcription initiation factor TFIID subunit 7-like protein [Heterocephalus glaber]